jgi:ferredoxin
MIEVFAAERCTSCDIRVKICPTNVATDGWNFGDSACGRGGAVF